MLTVIICLCACFPALFFVLCVCEQARRRRRIEPAHPDKPYEVEGRYVIGGRYGSDPLTGDIGYDRWPFQDERVAAYVVRWLNNSDDHRSLAMVWWHYAQLAAEAQANVKAPSRVHDPECNVCHQYVNRAAARTMGYLRSGRCPDCEVAWHERRLVASYQVPGVMLGDGPWQTEPRRATKFSRSSRPMPL